MIYSIVPNEKIFPVERAGDSAGCMLIDLYNIKAQVRLVEDDVYELQRIFSTDINDYLNPKFQPGVQIKLQYEMR